MLRPRIESLYPPVPVTDRLTRIGGADLGVAAELTGDTGHLWRQLALLDGSGSE